MPFDGTRNASLAERLAWAGITPVPDSVLEAHKAAEIRKHPESRLYRHREKMPRYIVQVSYAIGGLMASGATVLWWGPDTSNAVFFGTLCGIGATIASLMTSITVLSEIQIKGPAEWQERLWGGELPTALTVIARAAQQVEPRSRLVIGELIQDSVVLDPYLILSTGTERVCLGIWDGEAIIAIATRSDGGSDAV